jgi:hypothetical protein
MRAVLASLPPDTKRQLRASFESDAAGMGSDEG